MSTKEKQRLAIDGGKPYREKFLIYGSPFIGEEEIAEVEATLRSGWLGTGPRVQRFEKEFKKYVGSRHALGLNSCTAGLFLALDALGVGPGDEVIVPTMTFAATANVIVHTGATPVLVDVNRKTMNIDPAAARKKITARTKAIIPVHLAGRPCDMDAIMDIAAKHKLFVVEDAAHAIESVYKDKKIGTIGDITVFSFYVTKNIVTGEGGMVCTNSRKLDEMMRIKSLHGLTRTAWKRFSESGFKSYDLLCAGYKYNMMDIQAALGLPQLARIEETLKVRERQWKRYNEAFGKSEFLAAPVEQKNIRHARHLYTLLLDIDRLGIGRDRFIAALQAENIGSGIHYIALHLHSFYRKKFGFKRGDFPNAEYISDRTFSLPLSPKLTDADVEDVIAAVEKTLKGLAAKPKSRK
jgi:dTDP-4-amino-4,6-dideoxygalactose transaminase